MALKPRRHAVRSQEATVVGVREDPPGREETLEGLIRKQTDQWVIFDRKSGRHIPQGEFPEKHCGKGDVRYAVRVSRWLVAMCVMFVLSGLLFVWFNRDCDDVIDRCFPLVFTIYGVLFFVHLRLKKYVVGGTTLDIHSGARWYRIPYGNIIRIEKRSINLLFRHGRRRRIRAEADSRILFITFTPDGRKERHIMISPVQRELLADHLMCMIKRDREQP